MLFSYNSLLNIFSKRQTMKFVVVKKYMHAIYECFNRIRAQNDMFITMQNLFRQVAVLKMC